jgi:hypothetical protein
MAKAVDDSVLDGALTVVKTLSESMVACSAQPANYAGVAAVALADVAVATGDFTIANGDTSGRKVTVGAKSAVTIDTSGDATHVALIDVTNTTLRYVTTCTTLTLTAGGGNTVNFPAWDIEIADPT